MQRACAASAASSTSHRGPVKASCGLPRTAFADALTFAFEIAYRAPGCLSLAQRHAYGLVAGARIHDLHADTGSHHVVGRAKLGTPYHHVVGRAKLGTPYHHVVGRAELGTRDPI